MRLRAILANETKNYQRAAALLLTSTTQLRRRNTLNNNIDPAVILSNSTKLEKPTPALVLVV